MHTSYPSLIHAAAVSLLASTPAALAGDCASSLIVPNGVIHRLSSDQTFDCVEILPGGILHTNQYELVISGSGGLTCHSGGWLDVNGAGSVTLASGGVHTVDGLFTLSAFGATFRIDTRNSTITGVGEILGISSADIQIDADVVFTSEVLIHGGLTIIGDIAGAAQFDNGTFRNHGIVQASLGRTIQLDDDTPLVDSQAAEWRADGDGSRLWFRRAHTGSIALQGDFVLAASKSNAPRCPSIRFDADIETSGSLGPALRVGCIDVNAGAVFTHAGGTISEDTSYGRCQCR